MQLNDGIPGEDYAGTTVRAGAKVLADQGYISEYYWAWDLETIIDTVTRLGPVVVGTNWYPSMWSPDQLGIVKIEGSLAGGHAYLIDGANRNRGMARCKNSYSKNWGINGRFWMPFEVLERLLNEGGEACIAVEART
jgi:hypothetical protein